METSRQISQHKIPISLDVEALGTKVLDAAYTVHTALGPGLMESVYESCLAYEIGKLGLRAETQIAVPVKYQEVYIETGLRLDIWVERQIMHRVESCRENEPPLSSTIDHISQDDRLPLGLLDEFQPSTFQEWIQPHRLLAFPS